MNTVTLIDGSQADSASEAWRHECEARHIANLPTSEQRHDYVAAVAKRRGETAGQALQQLATRIYSAQRDAIRAARA